jgi:nucleotide-binding universal stress UspA family protein
MRSHVVLATRFGAESQVTAAEARRLASLLGGGITVVYVATELGAIAVAGGEAGMEPTAQREQHLASIREQLKEFVATHMRETQVDVRVIEGDVAGGVAAVAVELDAAYLVVGTHGRSTLARLVLGDTTHSILQHSPCPVVVVPIRD